MLEENPADEMTNVDKGAEEFIYYTFPFVYLFVFVFVVWGCFVVFVVCCNL